MLSECEKDVQKQAHKRLKLYHALSHPLDVYFTWEDECCI